MHRALPNFSKGKTVQFARDPKWVQVHPCSSIRRPGVQDPINRKSAMAWRGLDVGSPRQKAPGPGAQSCATRLESRAPRGPGVVAEVRCVRCQRSTPGIHSAQSFAEASEGPDAESPKRVRHCQTAQGCELETKAQCAQNPMPVSWGQSVQHQMLTLQAPAERGTLREARTRALQNLAPTSPVPSKHGCAKTAGAPSLKSQVLAKKGRTGPGQKSRRKGQGSHNCAATKEGQGAGGPSLTRADRCVQDFVQTCWIRGVRSRARAHWHPAA